MSRKTKAPALQIEIDISDPGWLTLAGVEDLCRQALAAAAAAATLPAVCARASALELSLCLADDATVQELNRSYRGQDKPTNVLSFASLDDPDQPVIKGQPLGLGDLILARETVMTEAKDQGKTLNDHLSHLVIHGFLHLVGYDHIADDQADIMEGLERVILARLDIADPYATAQAS